MMLVVNIYNEYYLKMSSNEISQHSEDLLDQVNPYFPNSQYMSKLYIGKKIHSRCVVQMLSHVQLFATLWTVACQAPLVHGIFQARILKWVAISRWTNDFNVMEFRFQTTINHKKLSLVEFQCSIKEEYSQLFEKAIIYSFFFQLHICVRKLDFQSR